MKPGWRHRGRSLLCVRELEVRPSFPWEVCFPICRGKGWSLFLPCSPLELGQDNTIRSLKDWGEMGVKEKPPPSW